MILPITNTVNYNNYYKYNKVNPTFEAKVQYKDIKNLHKLVCPRCGGPIIEPQKLIDAYKAVTLPLSHMIEKGYMDKSKDKAPLWNLLERLAKEFPKLSLDKILEDDNRYLEFRKTVEDMVLPNKDRYSHQEFVYTVDAICRAVINSSRSELKPASVVMKRLKSLLPYLEEIAEKTPFKGEIKGKLGAFEELTYYAHKYPKKRLSEIIDDPKIHAQMTAMKQGVEQEFRHKKSNALAEIKELINKHSKQPDSFFNKMAKETSDKMYRSNNDPGARLQNTKKYYKKLLQDLGLEKIYPKIEQQIDKIPETPYNKYTEFASFYNMNNDGKIIESLFKPFVGSVEHIQPFSKGGKDLRGNTLTMHKGCNFKRGSIGYKDYMDIYPSFPYNVNRQIEQITRAILDKRLIPKYLLYPLLVTQTLEQYTDGRIKPDVKNYAKKVHNITTKNIEEAQDTINELGDKRNQAMKRILELDEESDKLRADVREINKEHKLALEERLEQRRLLGAINAFLKNK